MSHTIDLVIAGVEPDGTPVYDWPLTALGAYIQRGVAWLLVNHLKETCRVVALAGIAGACVYFARTAK